MATSNVSVSRSMIVVMKGPTSKLVLVIVPPDSPEVIVRTDLGFYKFRVAVGYQSSSERPVLQKYCKTVIVNRETLDEENKLHILEKVLLKPCRIGCAIGT